MGREPHTRGFPRQAPAAHRHHGFQGAAAYAPPDSQNSRRRRFRSRRRGRRASRGAGARHRRGEPDDVGPQDRRGRDAARRARPGPAAATTGSCDRPTSGRRHDDQTRNRAARHEATPRLDRAADGRDHAARPPIATDTPGPGRTTGDGHARADGGSCTRG